jgi:hypothetical protein
MRLKPIEWQSPCKQIGSKLASNAQRFAFFIRMLRDICVEQTNSLQIDELRRRLHEGKIFASHHAHNKNLTEKNVNWRNKEGCNALCPLPETTKCCKFHPPVPSSIHTYLLFITFSEYLRHKIQATADSSEARFPAKPSGPIRHTLSVLPSRSQEFL